MLQVDLKLMRPISDERVAGLSRALRPMRDRLIVGSQAHWNLRRLGALPVAFDPTLHWHYAPGRRADLLPRALGIHGLWDDSPLAMNRQVRAPEYLEARVQDLRGLVPEAREWMVDIPTIQHLGSLGFSLGRRLSEEGCSLAAWTLRESTPSRKECLAGLFALGAETVITDVPLLAAAEAA
jgi:hypothetical protein